MGTFEYELLSAITKLIRDKDPVVAVYSTKEPLDPEMARFYIQAGQPMPPPTDNFASVSEFLRQEKYDVRAIELAKDNSIPSEANTVLVLGPRDLNERQRYEICQVLRRGGSVVVAAQATLYDYNPGPRGGYQISVRPQSLGINDLLSEFAVRIDDRLLMDTQMATLAIPSRRSFLGMSINVSEPVQAPMQIRVMGETINRDLPFTAGVPELLYLWGNQVIVDDAGVKEKNLKTTILLSGGPSSWTVDKKAGSLQQTDIVPEGHPVVANPTLAVLVEGVFPDPWEGKAAPEWPVSDSDAEEGASQDDHAHAEDAASQEAEVGAAGAPQPGRLLVIGCSKLFEDMLLDQAGHALFLLNSVDALTLGEDLISIRSKRYSQRTFAEVSDGKKLAFRVANIALVPVLVTVLGLGNRIRRRREAEEYASKFARAHGGNA
jgi:ABC-2 type transport system permease protein